jgi:ATP:ADP antiporter, AAA family
MKTFLQNMFKWNFGKFSDEELKKFLRLGLIFALIIGVYWTLRPLKDSIFIGLVGKFQLPLAKTLSVLALLPLVMFYTRLVGKFSKERMLIYLPTFYSFAVLGFSLLFLILEPKSTALGESPVQIFAKVAGYVWYLFVESYGSLVVALFWAFSSDITLPDSAKKGFPLVVAIGQLGGALLPVSIGSLPYWLGYQTNFLSIAILSLLIWGISRLARNFMKITPKSQMQSFKSEEVKDNKSHEASFFEGLKLMVKNPYLLGIFSAIFIYEVSVTVFDFNFKLAASEVYSGVALSRYLSIYGSMVSLVSFLCLILGISNITRFLGIAVSLAAMPLIVGLAFLGFITLNSLSFLFALMVGSKAINYALNGPSLKQLYIPTSRNVKFKSQAWIETFGSRISKQCGSMFNMTLAPLKASFGSSLGYAYYLSLTSAIVVPLLAVWFVISLFLGKRFQKAVKNNEVVC